MLSSEKPGVYSPLVIRVSESSAPIHNHHSTDAVNPLSSLPVQHLGNQENILSTEKQIESSEQFVQRVLAEADKFCRPLQCLSKSFRFLFDEPAGSVQNDGSLGDSNGNEKHFCDVFSLKRVSPLTPPRVDLSKSIDGTQPPTPKRRRHSKDSKASSPIPPPCDKQSALESQIKPHIAESERAEKPAWILPSLSLTDLRSRLLSILPTSSRQSPSSIDKLASLRFLLRGLRVSGVDSQNTTQRKLTGVLLAPVAPKPTPRFVELGTTMSPRQTAVSSIQCVLKAGVNSSAQTSPQIRMSVSTKTSPSLLTWKRASVSVNTDPIHFGVMENGFSNEISSMNHYLKKILGCNDAAMERTIRRFAPPVSFHLFYLLYCNKYRF